MDLQFCDLSVQIASHDTVAKQPDAVHFGLHAGSPMIAGQPLPQRAPEALASTGCPARRASFPAIAPLVVTGFHGLAFFTGRYDRSGSAFCPLHGAILSWRLRVSYAPSAVTVAMSSPGGICDSSSGSMGGRRRGVADLCARDLDSPGFQCLFVDCPVQRANVALSIGGVWKGHACGHAIRRHPPPLITVLSINRCSGSADFR